MLNKDQLKKEYKDILLNVELNKPNIDWFNGEYEDETYAGGYWDSAIDITLIILGLEFEKTKDIDYLDFRDENFVDLLDMVYDIIKYEGVL